MMGRWTRRLGPLVIVGGLLAAVAVLSLLGRPGINRLHSTGGRRGTGQATSTAAPSPTSSGSSLTSATVVKTHLPQWLDDIAIYGCGLVIAGVVGWLIWFAIRLMLRNQAARHVRVGVDQANVTRRDAVLAAVDEGIAELARADGDARAAVIACWVRLEEVATAAGTPPAAGDTSSDLVSRLLGEHQVSRSLLLSLADLYRTARYSTRFIPSTMREQALAALGRLRDELSQSRSGPLAAESVFAGPVGRPEPSTVRRPRPSSRPEAKR